MCIFNDTHIDLSKQLCNLSLAEIHRKQKTNFLTNDLYYDIQETIQDVYVCAAKMIKKQTDNSLYLYQLGTDVLENQFATLRTLSHSRNFDFLELTERLIIVEQIEKVFENNPGWRAKSKLNSTGEIVDHSSAINWSGNLKVDDLNIIQTWDYGFRHSKTILINYGYKTDDFYLSNDVSCLEKI